MHDQVIISQECSLPIIVFVQEHLAKIESYPVHTLLANISKSNAATTDGQKNISNNGNSSDEDRTVDCNQSSSIDRNHTLSLDEMKSENDENLSDSSHSSERIELKASIVEPAVSEASKVQICSPSKLSHPILLLLDQYFSFSNVCHDTIIYIYFQSRFRETVRSR